MAQSRFGGPSKRSVVDIADGLFIMRYKSSVAAHPPLVTFGCLATAGGRVRVLEQPGATSGALDRPGDVAALSVEGPVKLEIVVEARGRDLTAEAEIDLERVSAAANVSPQRRSIAAQVQGFAGARTAPGDLSLLCHVSRRGDLVAAAGEWIAGPSAPAPIEGLEVQVGGLDGLEIQVQVAGDDRWSGAAGCGTFIGTRGRARPLTGLRLRLTADAPADLELDASALFLGSAVNRRSGRTVEFASPSGREPLIGLSLRLATIPTAAPRPWSGIDDTATSDKPRGRVRVFRAGSEVTTGAGLPSHR